jgi:CRP/FNR family transcriptional regulator, anaerobic regulatory protein
MDITLIRKTFRQFSDDVDLYLNDLFKILKPRKVKPNEILLYPGNVCNKFSLLAKGVARNYFYKNEKEITSWFDFEGELIGSIYSYLTQTPSHEGIEMISHGLLYELNYSDFLYLRQNNKAFNDFTHNAVLDFVKNLEHRGRVLQSMNAQERYAKFVEKHPESIKLIPLKYIASFLDITPETLSRIKSKTYTVSQ